MSRLNHHQQRRIAQKQHHKLDGGETAIVVTHLGFHYLLDVEGEVVMASARKNLDSIACNDRVIISRTGQEAVIEAIVPRENVLSKFQGRRERPIAANADQLLIVIAVEPEPQTNLIDRYLIAAARSGLQSALLLNKIDLNHEEQSALLAPYQALDLPIFMLSLKTGIGLAELSAWLHSKTTLVCGQSGVGKSSLIKHFQPNADIWTQAISEINKLGKHTTTNMRRYPINPSTTLIDTPGVRGYSVHHLSAAEILTGFPDIVRHQPCRFNDCSHSHEPDCAIQSALARGEIFESRYQSLMQMLDECQTKE